VVSDNEGAPVGLYQEPGSAGHASDQSPPPRPPRHRRSAARWPRRTLIGANIVALVALVAAAGGYGYIRYKLSQIPHVIVKNLTGSGASPGSPENILLIGSDSRVGEGGKFGGTSVVAGQRSDVIILVHLDPATGKAAMLSIPRDTLVNVVDSPPYNGPNKINAAYNTGASGLVATIKADFGIPINHVVQVDFSGLSGIDNAVGGVCMHFAYPVRDGSPTGTGNESGLIEPAGNDVLNGTQALSLVRSRYYQYFVGGQWVPEGTGDLGRITRQHEFLQVLASKAIHDGIRDPITANSLISQIVKDVNTDQGLTPSDILGLIGQFHSLRPSTVPSFTLPTTIVNNYQGFGDVLMPIKSQDNQVIADWESAGVPQQASTTATPSTTTTTLVPSEITVSVLNGSGAPGQANQAVSGLAAVGFSATSGGNAASFTNTASVVTYGPGMGEAARVVAEHVEGGASVIEDPSITGSTVVLTTGSSFRGIATTANAGSLRATTATTVAPSVAAASKAPGQSSYPPWDPTPCSTGP
jgi:LCP family protein required for cell wall assembly